jgi:hypothetical protein
VLDFTSKVLTIFKSDTSELKAGLKDLQQEEKKLAQAQLEAAQQRNKGYDDWVGKLANVNQALELGGKVVGFMSDAWKGYAEDLKMAAAAGSANIDRLRDASLGLRTENELTAFAAKAQAGAIKANQEQMETAQRAMVALTRAGFDQHEVTEKVTNAMVSLKTRGLESLGVQVKEGKTDLETFNNLMGSLADKAKGVDSGTLTASESIQKMGVSMNDSMDKMKNAIGQLVQSMGPLLEMLAKAVSLIADIASEALKDIDPMAAARLELQKRNGTLPQAARKQVGAMDRWDRDPSLGTIDEGAYATFMRGKGLMGDQGKEAKPGKVDPSIAEDARERASIIVAEYEEAARVARERMIQDGYENAFTSALGVPNMDELRAEIGEITNETDRLFAEFNAKQYEKYQAAKQASFLESSFGKLEEFNAYAQAFQMLSGAVTASMDAWITGSMSAGQAIKKFFADALKGLASQMAVEALKHGAYAIGSLAFGDFRGAGQHAAAAAAFGSGAAAAAVAAKSLGGSAGATASGGAASAGASGGGGKGASGASGGGSSEGSNDKRPIVVVVGDHFSHMSNRQKAIYSQEAVDKAVRERDD